jgi:hypothetical protein
MKVPDLGPVAWHSRNSRRHWGVIFGDERLTEGTMEATVATDKAPLWRPVAWIALTTGLFLVLLLATVYLASRLTSEIGIADPEREHFALIQAILLAASLVVAVPLTGRLLGEGRWVWPGPMVVLAFVLAAAASYVIFADSRSGFYFETDNALPEVFVPAGIALLAAADLGRRSATTEVARPAWSWVVAAAGLVLLALVAMTVSKVASGLGGMYRLDSPLTFAALALAGAYGVAALLFQLPARRC